MTRHFDHTSTGVGTTATTTAVRPLEAEQPVECRAPAADAATGTGLHWGAVWAGALVALPVFLVLELLFTAFGWLDLGTQQSAASSIVSAVLALIAFFVGGVLAGHVAGPARSDGGVLHGALVWALTTAAIVAVAAIGAGVLAGDLGTFFTAATSAPAPGTASLAQSGPDAAGWGALWLGVSVIAAAIGGTVGAKTRR